MDPPAPPPQASVSSSKVDLHVTVNTVKADNIKKGTAGLQTITVNSLFESMSSMSSECDMEVAIPDMPLVEKFMEPLPGAPVEILEPQPEAEEWNLALSTFLTETGQFGDEFPPSPDQSDIQNATDTAAGQSDITITSTFAVADTPDKDDSATNGPPAEQLESNMSEPGSSADDQDVSAGEERPQKRARTQTQRIHNAKAKHPMKQGCQKCAKDCSQHISQEKREEIWRSYWDLSYNEQKQWLFHNIKRGEIGRSTTKHVSRRDASYTYTLKDSGGVAHVVCKTFFLETLGYHRKNDKPVVTALRNAAEVVSPSTDRRGRHRPANKLNR